MTVAATDLNQNTATQNWTFTVPAASPTFTYDENGNLLSDGTRTFTWDSINRLLSATVNGSGQVYSWTYDHAQRRVTESLNGAISKRFVWAGTEMIQERNGGNTAVLRSHVYGGFVEGSAALNTTAAKYLVTHDHLGNVRDVVAASTGASAARYDYTPFQNPIKLAGTLDASLLTIGRYYHHPPTGLELAVYRAYDPALGRWINEDPIAEDGGLNLYAFVRNVPIEVIDLLGLVPSSGGFWPNYPNYDDFRTRESVWDRIGGSLGRRYRSEHSCAARMSSGLNRGGEPIPRGTRGASRNDDGNRYIISAHELRNYLRNRWGPPQRNVRSEADRRSLQASLRPGQCAIVVSDRHAAVVRDGYQDPHVDALGGDAWILPP